MKFKVLILSTASLIMAFTSTQAQTTMANSDMEAWHSIFVISSPTLGLTAPTNWYCIDSLIAGVAPLAAIAGVTLTPKKMLYKSSDAYQGSFAAEVKTEKISDTTLGTVGGVLSNSQISLNLAQAIGGNILGAITYDGGTNVTGNVSKINAWVKTDSANTDNSSITAMTFKDTMIVAEGTITVPKTTTTYTNMEVTLQTIVPNVTADRLVVLFTSSDMSATATGAPTVGNSMKVDGVTYTMETTGITNPIFKANNLAVYPNPATGVLNFKLNTNEKPENYALTIMDLSGRIISTENLKQQITVKSIAQFASGTYFYNLTNVNGNKMETGKFIVK